MATWGPVTVVSPAPSRVDRARSPISRSTSPVLKAGDTATIIAFRNARDTYRKSLSGKDMKRIMIPTGPEDVINEIMKWQKNRPDSKVAAGVRAGLVRLQRFSASIDMLAQGTPSPGCLLWGSIKFVLTLCKALTRMIDCLPRIELYTETFLDSSLIKECVNGFYVSIIRFWAKACKFYRRGRLWNYFRVVWNDFDTEFSGLEVEMVRNRDRVESAALAEHIGESKTARVNQHVVNLELLQAQNSTRRKEITAWLAPTAYDVEYYSNDLATARALRHPNTCTWVLNKKQVIQLSDTTHRSEESFLWIYASPGTGKTVLSSFLIEHFKSREVDNVIYFFCKNTDVDKNTPTAVVRSLLYQLYKSVKDQKAQESFNDDLGLALDKSGHQRAVNFAVLWQLFSAHVKMSPATIILDALDECQDPRQLIQGLKELSSLSSINVIVTSRREPHLHKELKSTCSIEVSPEDVNADIATFVEAKVGASSCLSNPLVRDLVIRKLCNAHDGMFLWVYLMLKELKTSLSVAQVQDALSKLPTGLDGIYKNILQRLQTTLTRPSFDLCSKVLTWVVSAVRPLGIDEIKQALTLHYEIDGDTLLTDDRSFPYSDKDLELICGSLVTIRKGNLQVIHLTVKEFLRSRHTIDGSAFSSLLVDPENGSLQLTLVCLRCIAAYAEPLVDLESKAPEIDWALETDALDRCQARAPLLEYASFSWLVHLIDCKLDDLLEITPAFQKTFNSPVTFSWVETCMASHPDSTLRLLVGVDEVRDRFSGASQDLLTRQEASFQFLPCWCIAMSQLFEEYGAILARRPWEIYFIDLCNIFSADPSLRKLWQEYGETPLRNKDQHLIGYRTPHPPQKKPQPHLQLQQSLQVGFSHKRSVFLVHDEDRNIYIWGETPIQGEVHCISVQHDKTGQRLPPAEHLIENSYQKSWLMDHGISPNGRYLALVYGIEKPRTALALGGLTVIWQIDENISFEKRMNCEPWARVIFSHASESTGIGHDSRAVMFKDNRHCFTPSGMLDLLTGSRRPLPDSILDITLANKCFYSGNGQYLFVSEPSKDESIRAWRTEPYESSQSVGFSWPDRTKALVDVSPTGRYLLLGTRRTFSESEEAGLCLLDTNSNETKDLCVHRPLDYWDIKIHFSRHETRLIAFFLGRSAVYILIWDSLAITPKLTSYAKCDLFSEITPHQIYVHKAADSAVMVTETRSIQRIELRDEIKFLDVNKVIDDYPHRFSTISRASSLWALVNYGRKGGKLQIINMLSPNAHARHFDLEWSQSDIHRALTQGIDLPVGLSPDFRVLVINAEVFEITSTEGSGLSETSVLTPFTIEALSVLLEPYRHRIPYWNMDCQISPCNSHVLYVARGGQWGNRSEFPSAILLYRINLQEKSSARVALPIPKDLVSPNACFHPSLPLMAVSYASPTATELKDIYEKPPSLHLAIIDLRSLEMVFLDLPKGQPTEAMVESWNWCSGGFLPRLLFSDSGTFACLEGNGGPERWFQIIHRMDINPAPARSICISLSVGNSMVVFYNDDNASVALELISFDDDGFWKGTRPAVMLRDVAAYSSWFAAADRYLLLGKNDDEKMRLLIAPHDEKAPVIKTLSLTYAEARARLEKERRRLHATSQDLDLDEIV